MWFCFQLLKRKDKITIFSINFAPVQNPFRCVVGRIRSGYDSTFHKTLQNAWKSRTPCRRNPHLWVKSSLSLWLGEIEDKITKTTAISLAAIFVRKATFSFVENPPHVASLLIRCDFSDFFYSCVSPLKWEVHVVQNLLFGSNYCNS